MTMTTVISEGNLIPADLLEQIAAGEADGQQPGDFGFEPSQRLTDEIAAAWSDARAQWGIFQSRLQRLPDDDPATSVTREFWVIPLLRFLGYEQVTYMPAAALVDNRTYALSHRAGADEDAPPLHIVGLRNSLDRRAETGRPRISPHALLQEYLNATEHLWGIVTNGERLRLLRDSSRTARPVYVEFDLRTMLADEQFSAFALLYRLLHRSRLPTGTEDAPRCLLERYHQQAIEAGGRVRDGLREGVERALRELGNGLLRHPQNRALREQIATGKLTPLDYYRQLLRLVYRLLFLMVAEERHLIAAAPADDETADILPTSTPSGPGGVAIYTRYYSVTRLRRRAEHASALRGGRYGDLWLGLVSTFRLLENDENARVLGLSGLDGDLFSEQAIASLNDTRLTNSALLRAIHALSLYEDPQSRLLRRVNYSALDVEELGSVYESLLDYRPVIMKNGKGEMKNEAETGFFSLSTFHFELVAGTERKTTGSYYTRPELVQELVRSALDPVIDEKLKMAKEKGNRDEEVFHSSFSIFHSPEAALLSITICDPACGSGAFLLAAARRLGLELARVRTGERQPSPDVRRAAIRDVIARCIYGVDVNLLAVDLCKLSLWIEGHNAGMPLSFLDSHIRHGNSLVGAWRELVDAGIPDDAFKPVTGDVKAAASALRKRNKKEREAAERGQFTLDLPDHDPLPHLVQQARQLEAVPDHTVAAVQGKAAAYEQLRGKGGTWYSEWTRCNLWTAAFFLPLTRADDPTIPTSQTLLDFAQQPEHVRADLIGRANGLAYEMAFFHWELEFPQVFAMKKEKGEMKKGEMKKGDAPGSFSPFHSSFFTGFDVVLGNPPWERIKLQEQEHFVDVPAIRNARNKAEREKLIRAWRTSDDPAQRERIAEFDHARHRAEAESRFVRASGRYPLTAVGDVNTYALFAELDRGLVNASGRAGIIVPTGIATDDTTKQFFADLNQQRQLVSLYDFENREKLFAEVDSRYRFSLLTLGATSAPTRFVFFATNMSHLEEEQRSFTLTPEEVMLINPNTRTSPTFRTQADAELTKKIYRRVPVLLNERTEQNPWGVRFATMFHMSNDSHLFRSEAGAGLLPLYEAKLLHQFTHRWATYQGSDSRDLTPAERADPHCTITPRYWVEQAEVEARLAGRWEREWLLGFRDITNATNERTAIFSLLPRVGVGHTAPLMFLHNAPGVLHVACFLAVVNSLTFDYVVRQKVGGTHLTYGLLNQLPVLPPDAFSAADIAYIVPRVLELVYTAWDMQPFAQDVLRELKMKSEELKKADPHFSFPLAHSSLDTPGELKMKSEEGKEGDLHFSSFLSHFSLDTPGELKMQHEEGKKGDEHFPFSIFPFSFDEARRAKIRAELDARIARLYGLTRDELRYILDPHDVYGPDFPGETFRVLKEKETRQYGEYRTRRLVLAAFDNEK